MLVLGVSFSLISLIIYFWYGYGPTMLVLWLSGLILTATGLKNSITIQSAPKLDLKRTSRYSQIRSKYQYDLLAILGLLVLCAPLYLAFVPSLPVQINADEVTIMTFQKTLGEQSNPDPFGLSDYAGLPSFIFIVTGKLGVLLGGVTFRNMRLIHALFGLLIIIFSYVLFRFKLSRPWAFAAAAVLGTSHSLLMISRMAMRENTALLIEIAALGLLYYGLIHRSHRWTFIGGAIAGLSFYSYFPSRITLVVWMLFVALYTLCIATKHNRSYVLKFGLISLLGFAMVASPYAIASSKNFQSANTHPKQQILLYPEAREVQRVWVSEDSPRDGYKRNIRNGLTVFNNQIHDNGYIYPNFGNGFTDPVSGVLVWLGVLIVIWRLALRRTRQPFDLLMVTGLIVIWLTLALIINKAPNYTRMLVILPFMAYLVTIGMQSISTFLGQNSRHIHKPLGKYVPVFIGVIGILTVIGLNLFMAQDFIKQGQDKGDNIGSTARYIQNRAYEPNYAFYLAASDSFPYYNWGKPGSEWQPWMKFFAQPAQTVQVIAPDNVIRLNSSRRPLTIFMNNQVWLQQKTQLTALYPNLIKHRITSDGQLLAIEIN